MINIYDELMTTYINLFYGSIDNLNNLKITTPLATDNRLQDIINAISLNFAQLATIATIVLIVVVVVSLPIIFYKMFNNMIDIPRRKKKYKR